MIAPEPVMQPLPDLLRAAYGKRECPTRYSEGQFYVRPDDHTMHELVKYCLTKVPWQIICLYCGIAKAELFLLAAPYAEDVKYRALIDQIRGADELPAELLGVPCGIYVVGTVSEHVDAGLFPFDAIDTDVAVEPTPVREYYPPRKQHKTYNYARPLFGLHKRAAGHGYCVIVQAFPGQDYLRHYFYMIRLLLMQQQMVTPCPGEQHLPRLHIIEFPVLRENLFAWTAELDERDLEPHARLGMSEVVIMGHVKEVDRCLNLATDAYHAQEGTQHLQLMPHRGSPLMFGWHSYTHTRTGINITLLGFKYSYWGDTAYHIAKALYARGTRLIVYVAKLGTLRRADDILEKTYVPNKFYLTRGNEYFEYSRFRNPLLAGLVSKGAFQIALPEHVVSAPHVSLPTIMEESFKKREEIERLGALSVDNELAYFAKAASECNQAGRGTAVEFSALHFATDYLAPRRERRKRGEISMDNSSDPPARKSKERVLEQNIGKVLMPFLDSYMTRGIQVVVIDDCREYLDRWADVAAQLDTPSGIRRVHVSPIGMSNADELVQLALGEMSGTMFCVLDRADIVVLDWYLDGGRWASAMKAISDRIADSLDSGSQGTRMSVPNRLRRAQELLQTKFAPVGRESKLRVFGQLYLERMGEYLARSRRDGAFAGPAIVVTSAEEAVALGEVPAVLRRRVRFIPKRNLLGGVLVQERESSMALARDASTRLYVDLLDLCNEGVL